MMMYLLQIIDEKSLIKKYQKEISCLKEELQQLRCGIMGHGNTLPTDQEDLVNLKLQVCFTSYSIANLILVNYLFSFLIFGNYFDDCKNTQVRTLFHG
jgi:hypothetical protein